MTLRDAVAGASVVAVTVLAACGGTVTATQAGHNTGVCGGQTGVSTATSQKYVVVLVATTQVGPDVQLDAADSVSLSYVVPVTGPTPSPAPGCLENHQLC